MMASLELPFTGASYSGRWEKPVKSPNYMKRIKTLTKYAPLLLLLIWQGCATTSTPKSSMSKEQILRQPDVKGHPPTVFQHPLEEVRQAGMRALVAVGCEIKIQEPLFLAGERPHKFGLFVGSGGEKVKIFLYPKTETETDVWADTDLSFVGIAGQQNWQKQVFAQMTDLLNQPNPIK
jgi:hypothetical protein